MHFSYKQAFYALYWTLQAQWEKRKTEGLTMILSDMCPYTFADGNSADPASWPEFCDCCKEVEAELEAQGIELSALDTVFRCGTRYMRFFQDSFGYDLEDAIRKLSPDRFRIAFEHDYGF